MATSKTPPPANDEFDEQRVPFDQVLRKLVNAKPAHKAAAKGPAQRNAKRPPKKG